MNFKMISMFLFPVKEKAELTLRWSIYSWLGRKDEVHLLWSLPGLHNKKSWAVMPSFWKRSNSSCSCVFCYSILPQIKIMVLFRPAVYSPYNKWPFVVLFFLFFNATVAPRNLSGDGPYYQSFPLQSLKPRTFSYWYV